MEKYDQSGSPQGVVGLSMIAKGGGVVEICDEPGSKKEGAGLRYVIQRGSVNQPGSPK